VLRRQLDIKLHCDRLDTVHTPQGVLDRKLLRIVVEMTADGDNAVFDRHTDGGRYDCWIPIQLINHVFL
jgi:hypothetical protein